MILFLPLFLFHINHPPIPTPIARRQTMMTTDTTMTTTSVVEAKTKVCVLLYTFISF